MAITNPPLILIVEDESGIQLALSLLLELEGYRVMQAGDGEEGLTCLAETVPDLIITDYMMPNRNGLSMLREMRQDPRLAAIPVLMLSAVIPPEEDAYELVDQFLSKPVMAGDILTAITSLLKNGRGAS
ncbi:response regulator [Telmatospirillum sp. J64-1]|uniref:response regulator n=1 Tax=Telmatospirillum sp. J64-1 TaxID=2502183 RepID=UPI00163DA154|nr:response regulator [Telmatospirillum sp. J64-1]